MMAGGASVQNVSRMLGHSNIQQTLRYAKVLPESVLADFDKVKL
jgi:site-specific recombinase XerD